MYQNYNIKQVCLPIDLETKLEKNDFAHAIVQFVDSISDAVFLPSFLKTKFLTFVPLIVFAFIRL